MIDKGKGLTQGDVCEDRHYLAWPRTQIKQPATLMKQYTRAPEGAAVNSTDFYTSV